MKILIVDDKEEERYLAETLLKGSGYEVETAVNGAEALEKLHTEGFDMIVSDILMPLMDGFQFCRECKGDEKLKDIPFVFYTAEYIENEDKDFALKLGVDKFIRKPIESDEFIKLIQGVFRDVEEGKRKPVVVEMRILVVEDNEDSRNLLVKQLHAYGHELMAAADGDEALEQALAQPPDIIVSDILMPKMDGYQLCHECKRNDKLKDIPFVFYTATYTKEEDEKFALSLGAEAFVTKPTELDTFVQMLLEIVEKAKSGALAPAEVAPLKPSLYLTEHDKRIFAKLEDKVAQLEAEIVERKRVQEEVRHLNQILQLVRHINQLIIQVDNEPELLQRACNQLVDSRNYKLAWIGFTQEASYDILPVAHTGFEEDYLSSVKITWDDSEHGRGPTGMAIKTGRPFVMRDILNDERYRPWRDEALKRGYMSSVALPLTVAGKVAGAVNVYSGHPDAFDDAELSLLVELAGDISLDIEKIRQREARQRAEEQIKELQEYLQLQIDRMPIGLIVWDAEFRVQTWNPATEKIFGFTVKEALGKHPYDFIVPKEAQPHVDNIWRRLLEGDMTAYSVNENITKDGRTLICEWSNTPLKKADGTVVGVLSMVQDITERKQAEAKAREVETLRELDRLRSGLLANVSHELRTPLTSIKGFATTLLRTDVEWSEEEQRDYLQTIDQETERLIRLISDLLDMSRLEAGGLKLEKDNYQISEILDSVSGRLASLTEHHQLQVTVPSELPSVFVDQMRIGQVLTNLVENATKYSPEGSQITIDTQLAGDQIVASVTDRGEGIPPELLDRVFDRFYQAESVVTGRKSGTGLGLSICKGIIESHNGRIWVESKLGEGSKFSFSLPVGKGKKEIA